MKITIIGILFFLAACLAILRTVKKIQDENIGFRSGLIWILLWVGIGFFGMFPNILNAAMQFAQMGNRVLFVLVLAVLILLAIVFNQASNMENMNRNLKKLAREIAILNYKLEKKNKDTPSQDE